MNISEILASGYFVFLWLMLTGGIFIALYMFRHFIPIISPVKIDTNRFRRYFTIAEGIIWSIYLVSTALFFLKNNVIFSAVVFLFFLLLFYWYSRFALRDYIAGLVFKSENRFSLNEIIEVEGERGEIKKFHPRCVEIENENGKMILLPYSILLGKISSPRKISDTVLSLSFDASIYKTQSFEIVADSLRKYIISLPWAILKNEPKIQLVEETSDRYTARITLFSFNEAYLHPMRKKVEIYLAESYSPS